MSDTRAPSPARWGPGRLFLLAWAAVFVAGTAGELFGIELLQKITDLKRIFLY